MDNFFEILIYLFIIVSFVNSFLKKKKKTEKKADTTQGDKNEIPQQVFEEKRPEASGKDILEEIQNLFNPPVNEPEDKKKESFGDLWKTESYKEHYDKADYHKPTTAEHEVTTSEHTPTYSEHSLSRDKLSQKKVELPEQTVVERLLPDDQTPDYSVKTANPFLLMLKKEFIEKDSLKKYIVISEILGKPKALRR